LAPGDFWSKTSIKTKEIIRETEIIDEGKPTYRRMELVEVDAHSEIVQEEREIYIATPIKMYNYCGNYTNYDEAVDKCPKCGRTNMNRWSIGRRPILRWTVITRERELPEVAAFVVKHQRFIVSLKELNDTT
jgi:hypothetical protein